MELHRSEPLMQLDESDVARGQRGAPAILAASSTSVGREGSTIGTRQSGTYQ